ncbi:MAG: hypothetical protein P8M63_06770 [Paracoccaceae bacterium]|nr:hypothetical protein [Paracoccaceae bacterium]
MDQFLETLWVLALVALLVYVAVYVPITMARTRDRHPYGWLLISLLLSPPIAIIGLMMLGRATPESRI